MSQIPTSSGSSGTATGSNVSPGLSVRELLDANTLARGLSIWTVVACHVALAHSFWRPVSVFASAGKLAVSIFLFMSGLLLQYQVNRAGGKLELASWARKRFFRIYPLYWAGLVLTLLCAWYFNHRTYSLGTLVANFLGIMIWIRQKVVTSGYAVTFWFISLLLLCYVLFPLARLVRRKAWLVLGAFAVSAVAFQTGFVMKSAAFAFPAFFMGMAVADWLQRRGAAPVPVRLSAALFLPLLVMLAVIFKGPNFLPLFGRSSLGIDLLGCAGLTFIPWPALCLVAMLQKALVRSAPMILRGLLWVSGMSFGVYCVHEPLLVVVNKTAGAGHPWLGLLGYAALTLLAGWSLDALDRKLRGGG